MKIIITQNERGLLFRNGIYRKMLQPGKNKISTILGDTYSIISAGTQIKVQNVDIDTIMKDKEFADSIIRINVPDGKIAVRFEDGRICEALGAGKYFYLNVGGNITYELFDLSEVEIKGLGADQICRLPSLHQKIAIGEGETGLLYFDGKFERALTPGAYYFWNTRVNVNCEKVDMRTQELEINGQEILTADKVSLRINFVCSYRITDAVKLVSGIKSYKEQMYTVTQLALREYIGKFRFDELLEQKDDIAAVVLKQLRARGKELFVEFISAGIKDIILPGEIRDIMNTVLVAEKNAQANVIARREEVASTRSLLNTAKLLDENATLYKLKELEYLERICDKVGSISVGGGSLLSELQKILTVTPKNG